MFRVYISQNSPAARSSLGPGGEGGGGQGRVGGVLCEPDIELEAWMA